MIDVLMSHKDEGKIWPMHASHLLYLAAILHTGCSGGASTAMGVFSSILSTVYIRSLHWVHSGHFW